MAEPARIETACRDDPAGRLHERRLVDFATDGQIAPNTPEIEWQGSKHDCGDNAVRVRTESPPGAGGRNACVPLGSLSVALHWTADATSPSPRRQAMTP